MPKTPLRDLLTPAEKLRYDHFRAIGMSTLAAYNAVLAERKR